MAITSGRNKVDQLPANVINRLNTKGKTVPNKIMNATSVKSKLLAKRQSHETPASQSNRGPELVARHPTGLLTDHNCREKTRNNGPKLEALNS